MSVMRSRAQRVACMVARHDGASGGVPPDPLAALSDTFDGVVLDPKWSVHDPHENGTITVADGEVGLEIDEGGAPDGSFWYGTSQGLLVWQEVTGDFECVLDLRIANAADDGLPPDSDYRFAGLAAHDPSREGDPIVLNYVSATLGSLHTPGEGLRAQYVCTVDSTTEPQGGTVPGYDAIASYPGAGQLRLLRVGQVFTCAVRETAEDPWTSIGVIDRTAAPMPSTLHVGLTVHAAAPAPDIRMFATAVEFSTP